jgi:hypothetical protein
VRPHLLGAAAVEQGRKRGEDYHARQRQDHSQRIIATRPERMDRQDDRADQVRRQQIGAGIRQCADSLAGGTLIVGLARGAQVEQEYVEIAEVAYTGGRFTDRCKPTFAHVAPSPKQSHFPCNAARSTPT